MKKAAFSIALVLTLILTGCTGTMGSSSVETLQGWSFQYNEGTKDFSIFFALLDKNDRPISANVDVDIRIENENGDEVYAATKSVTPDDFGTYTSQVAGEEYLAELRIPESDIAEGTSSNGKVYLTVYKDDYLRFDEVNCEVMYCLPVKDVELTADPLPVVIDVKSYDGSIQSTIQIDDVSYRYEKDISPLLNITITGRKTHGKSGTLYDMISYKLYDNDGYLVESGELFLESLSEGDKFKDDSIMIYDIEPGKTYTISFDSFI